MAPSQYVNQCWNILNWNLRNKLQWNFKRKSHVFIQENAFENIVCKTVAILSWHQCVKMILAIPSPKPWNAACDCKNYLLWLIVACTLISCTGDLIGTALENSIDSICSVFALEILQSCTKPSILFIQQIWDKIDVLMQERHITPLLTHWSYVFRASTH